MVEPGDLKLVLLHSPCYSVSPFSSLPEVGYCHKAGPEQTQLHLTFTDGQGPVIEGLLARLGELSWGTAHTDRGCSVGLGGAFSVFLFGIPVPQSWPQKGWFCVWEQPERQLPRMCLSELGSIAVGPLGMGGWAEVDRLSFPSSWTSFAKYWKAVGGNIIFIPGFSTCTQVFLVLLSWCAKSQNNSDCWLFQQSLFGTYQLKAILTSPDTIYLSSVLNV